MLKALLRKQLRSLLYGLSMDKRSGKKRGRLGKAGFVLLFILLFFSVFMMFTGLSAGICEAFVSAGLDWLYFALAGLAGLVAAVAGSAFMSYSALFQAKDNELLMSMPIPPGTILLSRMLSIWFMALIFEFMAVAAAFIMYGSVAGFDGRLLLSGALLILFSSFLALALSCLLGWLVAILMSRVTNKSAVTVIFTLVFLGAYYSVYFRIQSILQEIVTSGERIGAVIRTWFYPVYQFGLAGSGDGIALLKYCIVCAAALALVYAVVAGSFIRIATSERGTVRKEYKPASQKAESLQKALFRKELRHFAGSPAYMLNAGLGIIFMPGLAAMLLLKRESLAPALELLSGLFPDRGAMAVVLLSAVCLLTTFNVITAPSINIEGKTLWITKSMPIDFNEFLRAKERLHLVLTCIPALPAIAAGAAILKTDLLSALLAGADVLIFIQFIASLGLFLNLKMPKLEWQNETQAVKNSLSPLICIFGGWVLAALPVLVCMLIARRALPVSVQLQLAFWLLIFSAGAALLKNAVKKQGSAILQAL